MTTQTYDPTNAAGAEALEFLRLVLDDDDKVDPAKVSAARALLDRFIPKEDVESQRREAEERAAALAEARCLLAEFAAAQSAGLYEAAAMAEAGAPEAADSAAPSPPAS